MNESTAAVQIEMEGEDSDIEGDIETDSDISLSEGVSDVSDSFHSVPSAAASEITDLDDSIDAYDDIASEDLPSRRSNRDRRAPKKLVYNDLGRPTYKTTERVRRPKK